MFTGSVAALVEGPIDLVRGVVTEAALRLACLRCSVKGEKNLPPIPGQIL